MGCKSTMIQNRKSIALQILDSLRIEFNPTTSIIGIPVAITDYLLEFSESVVANINFMEEPIISGVTLDPANASINIDGLFYNKTNNFGMCTSLKTLC